MRLAGDLGFNRATPVFQQFGFSTWVGASVLMQIDEGMGLALLRTLEFAQKNTL